MPPSQRNLLSKALVQRAQVIGLALAALVFTTAAQAGINKCTSADGKVVFSDQPCVASQGAAAVKPAVAPPPFKGSLADKQAVCEKLANDFYRAYDGLTKPVKTEAELVAMLKAMDGPCKGVPKPEDTEAANGPKPKSAVSKHPQVSNAQCSVEAHLIEKVNSGKVILGYSERQAHARSEAEFARYCEYK
jgi:hypothetical protein